MIPHTFHWIWAGSDPIPHDCALYMWTWPAHHPDWHFQLWQDNDLAELSCAHLYPRCTSPSQIKDIAALEILIRFGGVYLDVDFECLKPIDKLITDIPAFYASEDNLMTSTGILGSIPFYPPFVNYYLEVTRIIAGPTPQPSNYTGPFTATYALNEPSTHPVVRFPRQLMYPYGYWEKEKKDNEFPDAYAKHHWMASWMEER